MSNSLIPYSFIPGTKAKANEVNANFIALANQITENKEYMELKLDETKDSINEDRASVKLDNTTLISNCILEAPNGVLTYTGNTITVKAGLKVLIPDGRNEDGSLKSIEYTVPEDVLLTTPTNETKNCVYVSPEAIGTVSVFQHSVKPPAFSGGVWCNPVENKNYLYTVASSSWEDFPAVLIAAYENSDGTVKNMKTVNPVGLLKEHDILSILTMGLPDYKNAIGRTSDVVYTATVNGFLYGLAETQQGIFKYINVEGVPYEIGFHNGNHIGWSALMMPVRKGAVYSISAGITRLVFIPMKGEIECFM